MGERVFDIGEADALIPRLEFFIGKIQTCARCLREEVGALAAERGTAVEELSMPQILRLRPRLHAVVEEINRYVGEIEDLGGVLKDLELGLVDLPATIGGERAYLCWQYGEKAIGFWHGLEDGFAGRQPLTRPAGKPDGYLQ